MSEARQRLRELLDRAADGEPVKITRRGELAAVLVSPRDFERLSTEPEGFVSALRRFRASTDPADLLDDGFDELRDHEPGRSVTL